MRRPSPGWHSSIVDDAAEARISISELTCMVALLESSSLQMRRVGRIRSGLRVG